MRDKPPAAAPDWRQLIDAPHDFVGAKLALFLGDDLLTYRRDAKPGIPHPGCRDLAGGGREGDETPFECAARELFEEFGLRLAPPAIVWARSYPAWSDAAARSWFMVGRLPAADAAKVRFGDEGADWRLVPAADFLGDETAVPYLKDRLRDYIAEEGTDRTSRDAV